VLRLAFRSMQFVVDDDTRGYMLRLRRLALSILGWSFPPGNIDVFLFGNREGDGKASLGWYAAYAAPSKPQAQPPLPATTQAAPTLPEVWRERPPRRLPTHAHPQHSRERRVERRHRSGRRKPPPPGSQP
jgi:hypothetical protein